METPIVLCILIVLPWKAIGIASGVVIGLSFIIYELLIRKKPFRLKNGEHDLRSTEEIINVQDKLELQKKKITYIDFESNGPGGNFFFNKTNRKLTVKLSFDSEDENKAICITSYPLYLTDEEVNDFRNYALYLTRVASNESGQIEITKLKEKNPQKEIKWNDIKDDIVGYIFYLIYQKSEYNTPV